MTSQLTALVASSRADDLSHAAAHTRVFTVEPDDKPPRTRRGWLARLRTARLWQQECAEHQL